MSLWNWIKQKLGIMPAKAENEPAHSKADDAFPQSPDKDNDDEVRALESLLDSMEDDEDLGAFLPDLESDTFNEDHLSQNSIIGKPETTSWETVYVFM